MEELIPIIFFILWFLFGTLGSKQKREGQRQRAEAERAAREAAARARAEQRRAMRESREAGGRMTFPDAQETATGSSGGTGTSLDMVPDELWAILTGGAPRPTGPSGPEPTTPRREPVPEGGWVTSPPWDEEDAVDSIEGVSAETSLEDVHDYDDTASEVARARYENVEGASWEDRPSRDSVAVRQSETSDARHVEFHDALRASEIGAAPAFDRGRNARARLGLQGMDDVRRAIVLAEILGKPKALR